MAELDLAGGCCTVEPVGTLLFICMGESTNDVVDFQARRTEVTSAVFMSKIKLKMAQESKLAPPVTYGKSTTFTELHFFPRELQFIRFFSDKPLSENKYLLCPRRETVGSSLHLNISLIILALLGST